MNMFKVCAAILNFGNMKFKQKPRDEQAEVADPAGMCFLVYPDNFFQILKIKRIKLWKKTNYCFRSC